MSRKSLIALAISIAISPITFLPSAANAETVPATFVFQGSGYGHGVGMSQIGARAKALASLSFQTLPTLRQFRQLLHFKEVATAMASE